MHARFLAIIPALLLVACGEDKDTEEPIDTDPVEDTAPEDPCTPEALLTDALENGESLMAGVSLEESTAIADILADMDTYAGQLLRIEGTVTELCTNQGCWAALTDPDGETINLKVVDGTLDFRDHAEIGYYAVGEGIFADDGGHGPQVEITGTMIGTVLCD